MARSSHLACCHAIDLKSKAAELELAVRRGTLVEKRLVERLSPQKLIIATRATNMKLRN